MTGVGGPHPFGRPLPLHSACVAIYFSYMPSLVDSMCIVEVLGTKGSCSRVLLFYIFLLDVDVSLCIWLGDGVLGLVVVL